ncbi:MAG: hypothetical protein J6D47_10095 [Peptostreptococcaceae bacterium]|nr:hypothetical protein [Peptostreptococcaceae bacterium]
MSLFLSCESLARFTFIILPKNSIDIPYSVNKSYNSSILGTYEVILNVE